MMVDPHHEIKQMRYQYLVFAVKVWGRVWVYTIQKVLAGSNILKVYTQIKIFSYEKGLWLKIFTNKAIWKNETLIST